jgi:ATP-binding cassette subfamily B protein
MFSSRKIKFIRQVDSTDCGTACLSMITHYFGANYSLDYLNELCHKTRIGIDFISLSRASAQLGLTTKAIRIGVDDFSEETLPCILHWDNKHFVVLYKVKRIGTTTYYYIADPAQKKMRFTKQELEQHFLKSHESFGYAMLFWKEAHFQTHFNQFKSHSLKRYSIKYIKEFRSKFMQLIVLMFLASGVTLTIPYISQLLVDKAIKFQNESLLLLLVLAQFALFLGDSLITFLRNWLTIYVSGKIGLSIIRDFLCKLFKLPMHYFETKSYGDFSQRIQDHRRLEQFLTSDLVNTLFSVMNLMVYGFVVYTFGLAIFIIFFVSIVLGLMWLYAFQAKRKKIEHQQFQKQVENQNTLHEIVGGIQDIKLFGVENQHTNTWSNTKEKLVKLEIKSAHIEMLQSIGFSFFQHGKNILITYIAAIMVIHNQLTLGKLLSLSFILGQTINPLNQLLTFINSLQDSTLSMNRLLSVQLVENEVNSQSNLCEIPPGDIVFKQVNFTYTGQHTPLLKNLNFTIRHGKTTAIVGESGSGKTTLLRLILGYYQNFEGDVFVGDISYKILSPKALRNNMSTVMQQGFIFDQSFLYNVSLGGKEELDVERFTQALQIANLVDFVNDNLRGNVEVKIGRNGLQLSGGQIQRILIARAVYKQAAFFLFDEATSALDTQNELHIMTHLYDYFKGRTVVLVAHRLSTVKNADNILVIDHGCIVEQGKHDALLAKQGKYFELIKNQLT